MFTIGHANQFALVGNYRPRFLLLWPETKGFYFEGNASLLTNDDSSISCNCAHAIIYKILMMLGSNE